MGEDRTFDVGKPVTNPALIAAIDAARANFSGETEALLIAEIKKAHFLSPVTFSAPPEPDENGRAVIKEKTTISFFNLTRADGTDALPAFTDWDELRKWKNAPDTQTIVSTYEDLCGMVKNRPELGGFVIDPFGRSLLITPEVMEHFEHPQYTEQVIQKGTRVVIGAPGDDPRELTDAVARYLKSQKNVKSAYLVLMDREGEQSYLMAVDFTGDRRKIFDGIGAAAAPHLKKGELLDITPLEGDGLGADIARGFEPFYRRESGAFRFT